MPEGGCAWCGGRSTPAVEAEGEGGRRWQFAACVDCGSLALVDPPADLGDSYNPDSYYSFAEEVAPSRGTLLQLRSDPIGTVAARVRPVSGWRATRMAMAAVGRHRSQVRVLDVGCGAGRRVMALRAGGVGVVEGIDPFLPADGSVDGGVDGLRRPRSTRSTPPTTS